MKLLNQIEKINVIMQSNVKKQLHEMQILIIHDKTEVDPKNRIKCFVGCDYMCNVADLQNHA